MAVMHLALAPHERTALARGSVLLLRPVEPEWREIAYTVRSENRRQDTSVWMTDWGCAFEDGIWWVTNANGFSVSEGQCATREEAQVAAMQEAARLGHFSCPLGRPGDTLETDAGPVVVRAVRVERCVEITIRELCEWGLLRLEGVLPVDHIGERLALWATLYPAHPWGQAWCWAVTAERMG